MRNLLFSILGVLITYSVSGQESAVYTLDIQVYGDEVKIPKYKTIFSSSEARDKEMSRFMKQYYDNGYLTASYDNIQKEGTDLTALFDTGIQYKWARINPGNAPIELLEESGWDERDYRNKAIEISDISRIHQSIISHFENHGHPFVSVQLDSVVEEEGFISASLVLNKGDFFVVDSVIVKGDVEISQRYIENYINVKAGDAYNEEKIKAVDTRIEEIPFMNLIRPMELLFSPGKVQLYLYAEKKKSSDINAIVGIVPDQGTGKLTWVGDGRLRLKNALKRGELVDFNIRRMANLSQDLKINFNYPFLFNTDFGSDFLLKIFRRDTTYLEFQRAIALQYLLPGGNYLEVFAEIRETSVLSSQVVANASVLSQYGDVSITSYGLGITKEKYDYKFNPRTGFGIKLKGSVGNKIIIKNKDYPEILYEGIKLKSTQLRVHSTIDLLLPIKSRSAIYVRANGGTFMNENILLNELFRFGGIHTLRGFDVESISATSYGIFTFEYRYLLERNSRWYVFLDMARYERNIITEYTNDNPYGFGTGMSFETAAGIFSINYALGSEQGNPILLRSSRVHFGFVNFF